MSVDPSNPDRNADEDLPGGAEEPAGASTGPSSPPRQSSTETLASPPAQLPKKIGQFHVKSVIGTGGMGTVYVALQEHPRRVVAVKVLKGGIASRSAMRRFEYESQTLARLRHPGIAQVYEAGTYDDGTGVVPYFAMEYIPSALPITKYAKERCLTTRQKLELFAHVCDAVHHGHQKGIIHRDLKPGNILVDSHGGVKVIDFGVARGTDSDMAVTTVQTDIGQLIGTLQYMSPEQCVADPYDIDIRSDVYALGVVLYELLAGRLPYDVSKKAVLESTRMIREDKPTRLSTVDVTLRGDSETIVFKALEKDRERRYQSALELAQDVRRYLTGEAIIARPPSITYQLRVFARRNKAFFTAVAAAFVVLVAGVIVSTSLYLRSESARREAIAARNVAENARGAEAEQRRLAVKAKKQAGADRDRAMIAEKLAQEQRDLALDAKRDALRQAYSANIAAAKAAMAVNEIATVRRRLDAAPEEFRNWEWRYLNAQSDDSLAVLVRAETMGSVALSPDGTHLASSLWDETVHLWDATTGRELDALRGHEEAVYSVAYSPDGTRLASGSEDTTVRLWDVHTGKELSVLRGHVGTVQAVAFSPDGTHLASAGGWGYGDDDDTVRLWDVASGKELVVFKGHEDHVYSVAFSPDGASLASGSRDKTVRLWDVFSGKELIVCRGHDGSVGSVAFSPDGKHLVSASGEHYGQPELDNTVRVWDASTCEQLAVMRGHKASVNSVAFSPDGRHIASGSADRTLRLWDATTCEPSGILRGHEYRIWSVAFISDGTQLVSGSEDGTIRLWDAGSSEKPIVLRGHNSAVFDLAFSPDGTRLASASGDYKNTKGMDNTVRIWDATTGEQLSVLRGHGDRVRSVAFSPDGTRLASGSWDSTVRLWDATTGEESARLLVPQAIVWDVTFSPDGTRLAAGCTHRTEQSHNDVHVWNASTFEEVAVLRGHEKMVSSVAFSPDGTHFASASQDGTIRLWDTSIWQELAVLKGPEVRQVNSLAFTPDGTRLASAVSGRTVRLWQVSTGKELAVLRGHEDFVRAVAFSPDGTRLASGSFDKTVRLWDSSTGENLAVLRGHRGAVLSVMFSPDGTRLASASDDKTVRIWDSVPYRVRYKERQAILAAQPKATRIVDDLWQKYRDWRTVALRARNDTSLSDPVRRAALNEVLRQATRHP